MKTQEIIKEMRAIWPALNRRRGVIINNDPNFQSKYNQPELEALNRLADLMLSLEPKPARNELDKAVTKMNRKGKA